MKKFRHPLRCHLLSSNHEDLSTNPTNRKITICSVPRPSTSFNSTASLSFDGGFISFYQKVDGKTKKKILGLVFADKIEFDENRKPKFTFTPPIKALIQISQDAEKDDLSADLLETFVKGSGDFKVHGL